MSAHAAALASGDVNERLGAIAEISANPGIVDAEDLRALVACLGSPRKAVQRPAAEACAAFGAAVRPLLLEALGTVDVHLRWGAAWALSRFDPEAAELLPAVLEAIGSADGDVRWAAADIVLRLARRHGEVAAELLRVLGSEPAERRKMALYCLRELPPSTAANTAAVRALGDPDEGVVLAALAAVARLAPDDDAAVAAVLALLDSPNPRLQRAAASALRTVGRGRAEVDAALDRAAISADESLRRASAGARQRR